MPSVYRIFSALLFSGVIFFISACTSDTPDNVLSQSEMEEVLYDYHLALAIEGAEGIPSRQTTDEPTTRNYYIQAVYKKYGLTEKDFNRSLQWYTRHSEILFNIYKNIDQRLSESGNMGTIFNSATTGTHTGDTLNIWRGVQAVLLSSTGVNRFSFTQKADTSLQEGDRLTLRFNAHWIYREGSKTAVAQIAIRYDNDSVAASTQYFYSAGYQNLTIRVGSRSVKSVTGFIYQTADWSERPKLLTLSDFSLLRIRSRHELKPVPQQTITQPEDTLRKAVTAEQRLRDSLIIREETENRRSHFEPIDVSQRKR